MVNPLDRVIGWIDPRKGLERVMSRKLLARAYEAASPRDPWRPRRAGASANSDHSADATALRVKARALYQNVPYIQAGINARVAATVGTGITPRATGSEQKKINALLARWIKECDADGRLDYYGLCAAALRAMEVDGEVLVRLRRRNSTSGLQVPLQLQLLEIDWLDSSKTATYEGNQIVNGIEYGPDGLPKYYWLFDQHPGDAATFFTRSTSHRVPARDIIHLFEPIRPGQGRGITRLAPVIPRVRDTQLYEDAEINRKNLETRLSVLASGDVATMSGTPFDGGSGSAGVSDMGDLPSGSVYQMPVGTNFTVVEPKAAGGYVEYMKYQMHIIATGMGVTYEMLTGDMSEVNFSSARVRLLDFRREVSALQWLVLIPKLLEPIHRAFIDTAVLAGHITQHDYKVDFSTPKWDYVNPQQDVQSDLTEIGGGLSSISEKLRQRGYNPEDVFAELKSDIDKLKELGLLETLLFLQKGNLPTQAVQDSKKA